MIFQENAIFLKFPEMWEPCSGHGHVNVKVKRADDQIIVKLIFKTRPTETVQQPPNSAQEFCPLVCRVRWLLDSFT